MSFLSLLLNVLWIICGGLYMALAWFVAAILMAITIVGLPWTRAAFNIGIYTLLPFGQKAVSRAGAEVFTPGIVGPRHRLLAKGKQSVDADVESGVAGRLFRE